jgi:bacillithiol biosynthesis cysteine-adding enzyme BshC
VAAQTERLLGAGYPALVSVAAGASNVFRQDELGRDRLVRQGAGWLLRRSRRRLDHAELLRELEQRPEAFSPNVLLRPVVESALFPTLAYVGGPAETSYFAQIGCLFHEHGIAPPLVHPRLGVTLVEGKVRKVLERFSLGSEDVRRPFEEVAAQLVRDQVPDEVSEALAALRNALQAGYARLGEAATPIDPTLRGPITGARNQALAQTAELEKKIRQHLRQQNETRLEQLRKAAANLYPEGVPQERLLNVYPYLVRYGPGLIDAIRERIPARLGPAGPAGWDGLRCQDGLPQDHARE